MYLPSKTIPYLDMYLVLLPLLYLLYITAWAFLFSFLLHTGAGDFPSFVSFF